MNSNLRPLACVQDSSEPFFPLGATETVVIVVIMILASTLVASGMTVATVLELLAGTSVVVIRVLHRSCSAAAL